MHFRLTRAYQITHEPAVALRSSNSRCRFRRETPPRGKCNFLCALLNCKHLAFQYPPEPTRTPKSRNDTGCEVPTPINRRSITTAAVAAVPTNHHPRRCRRHPRTHPRIDRRRPSTNSSNSNYFNSNNSTTTITSSNNNNNSIINTTRSTTPCIRRRFPRATPVCSRLLR